MIELKPIRREAEDMKRKRSANEVNDWIRQAKASLAVEGLHLTKKAENLVRAQLLGDISHQEFLRAARRLATTGNRKNLG